MELLVGFSNSLVGKVKEVNLGLPTIVLITSNSCK